MQIASWAQVMLFAVLPELECMLLGDNALTNIAVPAAGQVSSRWHFASVYVDILIS